MLFVFSVFSVRGTRHLIIRLLRQLVALPNVLSKLRRAILSAVSVSCRLDCYRTLEFFSLKFLSPSLSRTTWTAWSLHGVVTLSRARASPLVSVHAPARLSVCPSASLLVCRCLVCVWCVWRSVGKAHNKTTTTRRTFDGHIEVTVVLLDGVRCLWCVHRLVEAQNVVWYWPWWVRATKNSDKRTSCLGATQTRGRENFAAWCDRTSNACALVGMTNWRTQWRKGGTKFVALQLLFHAIAWCSFEAGG